MKSLFGVLAEKIVVRTWIPGSANHWPPMIIMSHDMINGPPMIIISPPSRFVRKSCSKVLPPDAGHDVTHDVVCDVVRYVVLPPDAGHDVAEGAACVVAAALEQAFLRRPYYNYCLQQR